MFNSKLEFHDYFWLFDYQEKVLIEVVILRFYRLVFFFFIRNEINEEEK